MKQLLSIVVWKYTDEDIFKIKEGVFSNKQLLSRLPEYCVRDDNKLISFSDYYLQFIGTHKDLLQKNKEYYLFDVVFASSVLNEEILNASLESLFKEFNIKLTQELLNELTINPASTILPTESHLVFDITYTGNKTFGFDDVTFSMELIGYLNKEMQLCFKY